MHTLLGVNKACYSQTNYILQTCTCLGLVDPKTLPRHHPNINEGFYTLGGTFDAIFCARVGILQVYFNAKCTLQVYFNAKFVTTMKIIYHITLTIPPIIQFHLKDCFKKIKQNAYTQFDSRKQVFAFQDKSYREQ